MADSKQKGNVTPRSTKIRPASAIARSDKPPKRPALLSRSVYDFDAQSSKPVRVEEPEPTIVTNHVLPQVQEPNSGSITFREMATAIDDKDLKMTGPVKRPASAVVRRTSMEYQRSQRDSQNVERAILARVLDNLRRGEPTADHTAFWNMVERNDVEVGGLVNDHHVSTIVECNKTVKSVQPQSTAQVRKSSVAESVDDFIQDDNGADEEVNLVMDTALSERDFLQCDGPPPDLLSDPQPTRLPITIPRAVLAPQPQMSPTTQHRQAMPVRPSSAPSRFASKRPSSAAFSRPANVDAWVKRQEKARGKSDRPLSASATMKRATSVPRLDLQRLLANSDNVLPDDSLKRVVAASTSRPPSSRPWTLSSMTSHGQKEIGSLLKEWNQHRSSMSRIPESVLSDLREAVRSISPGPQSDVRQRDVTAERPASATRPSFVPRVDLKRLSTGPSSIPSVPYEAVIGDHLVSSSSRPNSAVAGGNGATTPSITLKASMQLQQDVNSSKGPGNLLASSRSTTRELSNGVLPSSASSRPGSARPLVPPPVSARWQGRPSSAQSMSFVRSDLSQTHSAAAGTTGSSSRSSTGCLSIAIKSQRTSMVPSILTDSLVKHSSEMESMRKSQLLSTSSGRSGWK